MILKGFYDALFAQFSGIDGYVTNINGSSKSVKANNSANWIMSLSSYVTELATSKTGYGYQFGTGDTPAIFTDNGLRGDFISGLAATFSKSVEDTDGGKMLKILATITNNNSTEVTIKEVCIVTYANNGNIGNFAIERTVLDTPVTIAAGGFGQVEYTIKFNYPTA